MKDLGNIKDTVFVMSQETYELLKSDVFDSALKMCDTHNSIDLISNFSSLKFSIDNSLGAGMIEAYDEEIYAEIKRRLDDE